MTSEVFGTGPPPGIQRVKEWVGFKFILIVAYAVVFGLVFILSGNLGKVTYKPPPMKEEVAMVYDHNNKHRFHTVGYNYRL